MKLVIAATGASGSIYLQRLLQQIDCAANQVHLVLSNYAREVARQELDGLEIPDTVSQHAESDMRAPFVSGSARFDAMVIVPCSMATLGRIASGSSDPAGSRRDHSSGKSLLLQSARLSRGGRGHGGLADS
jgi:4-hydroxy-3-polyprenylbenzoate decarboxylase